MDIYIPENVEKIIDKLEASGYESYIVGGCVRDAILGKAPKDYDVTTSATPDIVKECLKDYRIIDTGLKHGTVTVVSDNENIEVTTFRLDGEYHNHRCPDSVTFSSSLIDDLSRRDFTINAMAYNKRTGIIDKFGGQKDLFRQRIACIGEPAVRFNEDALRILRAMRFASVLNFTIDEVTAVAIHDLKRLLLNVSAERISAELDMIITGAVPAAVLTQYADVIAVIIPEMKKCIGFDQHSRYHVYDVWTHIAEAVEHSEPNRDVRLALLLHDIAKPQCCKFDEEGSGHFFNHEKEGAEIAETILRRLHYPKDTVECVCELIKYHYVTPVDDRCVVRRLLATVGKDNFYKLIEVMKGDSRSKQSFCFERVQTLELMKKLADEVIADGDCISISSLAINGNDIAELGACGAQIGKLLEKLLSSVMEEKTPNERNELLKRAKQYM